MITRSIKYFFKRIEVRLFSSYQTSFVENCETSAWGRCLANLSIGIDSSIASALEMQNAVRNQKEDGSPITKRAI